MSGESFEWAIKKDVRNNPIVREVDLERHRNMWRSAGFSVFFVAVLLFTVWRQLEVQQYGYEMGNTQQDLEKEQSINRQLRLEIATLEAPQRVDKLARERLHMVEPTAADAIIIERVIAPPTPPRSVVAQR